MPHDNIYGIKLRTSAPEEPPRTVAALKKRVMGYYNKPDYKSKIADVDFLPCPECVGRNEALCKRCGGTGELCTLDYSEILRKEKLAYDDEVIRYSRLVQRLDEIKKILRQDQIQFIFEQTRVDMHVCPK